MRVVQISVRVGGPPLQQCGLAVMRAGLAAGTVQ